MDNAPLPHTDRPAEVPAGIERITGHGAIYRQGLKIRESDYDLTITPAELRNRTFEPGEEPKVSPDITGQLLGSLFKAEDLEGVHTLVLEDGRAFDFRVIQPDTNEIIGVSWFEDAPRAQGVSGQEI